MTRVPDGAGVAVIRTSPTLPSHFMNSSSDRDGGTRLSRLTIAWFSCAQPRS